ncbi:hypothetical protein OS493_035163, partial [Desmophyllum pertusum]
VGQEFKNVWRVANESTKRLQSEMTSSMQVLQTKVDNEMETVWFHLNKSRKCCNNLTSSFLSFRKNVTYHSKRIEDRIEIEEQKSNNTSQVEEQHSKKIQRLENLLNDTRKDIKEVSREHFKTLWLAGNFTNAELHRVWTAVNLTQIDLLRQLKKVKYNLTEQLNLTTVHLQTSDASLFASLSEVNASITEKVNDVSKMAGPIGPPGYNGSQGPAGPAGSIGPPGPKGAGNFSSCQYKVVKDSAAGGVTTALVGQTEPDGKRITGATCSTNFATEYNMLTQLLATGKWRYVCSCKGTSALFRPGGDKNCYLHYWECPLTT